MDDATLQAALIIIRQLARHFPPHLRDDLRGEGAVGLMEAWHRYRPETHVPFLAYARPRIKGAMLDALRLMDPASRGDRKRIRAGTLPAVTHLPIDDAVDERFCAVEAGFDVALERQNERHVLQDAMHQLPLRLYDVLRGHYWRETNHRVLEDRWRVGESRLTQLREQARRRLRDILPAHDD